jgi:predicted transcriptional regulator
MSSAELKYSLHQLIDGITDKNVLQAVYTLLYKASEDNDWWNSLSEKSKQSILRGLDDADNGRFISDHEVKAKVNKLLGRA